MKRVSSARRLHMGCGEGLTGRLSIPGARTATLPGGRADRHQQAKMGKGKR